MRGVKRREARGGERRGEAHTSVAVLRNVTIFDVAKLGEHGHELVTPAMEQRGGTRARKSGSTRRANARERREAREGLFFWRGMRRALRLGCAQGVFVRSRPRLTHVMEKGKLSTLREMRPPMSGGPCAMAAGATWYVADY